MPSTPFPVQSVCLLVQEFGLFRKGYVVCFVQIHKTTEGHSNYICFRIFSPEVNNCPPFHLITCAPILKFSLNCFIRALTWFSRGLKVCKKQPEMVTLRTCCKAVMLLWASVHVCLYLCFLPRCFWSTSQQLSKRRQGTYVFRFSACMKTYFAFAPGRLCGHGHRIPGLGSLRLPNLRAQTSRVY